VLYGNTCVLYNLVPICFNFLDPRNTLANPKSKIVNLVKVLFIYRILSIFNIRTERKKNVLKNLTVIYI